jgi:hypothetical protein
VMDAARKLKEKSVLVRPHTARCETTRENNSLDACMRGSFTQPVNCTEIGRAYPKAADSRVFRQERLAGAYWRLCGRICTATCKESTSYFL